MAFYETSAKDKTMVDEAFFALTRDIKKRLGESSGSASASKQPTGPITVPAASRPCSRAPPALLCPPPMPLSLTYYFPPCALWLSSAGSFSLFPCAHCRIAHA